MVTLLLAWIAAGRAGFIRAPGLSRLFAVGAWVMFAYFVLNIAGNLASASSTEKLIFTPVSLIVAAQTLRLASEK